MKKVVIIGGGYAGFYAARGLEKKLHAREADITIVDPRPYMTYQPFLPEVMAGSIEARHAAVSLRRHLKRAHIVAGMATRIDHERKTLTVRPVDGPDIDVDYDIIVVTAGVVTRKFPIPGLEEQAIGLKYVEEAVAIRDRLLTAFDRAAALPPGALRSRLLTVTFVGGGFSGVEGFGELLSLASALLRSYPELHPDELSFHLVEANSRILPEVTDKPAAWVVRSLEKRGARVHLSTQLTAVTDGRVVLSNGVEYDCDLVIWTAGSAANPVTAKNTDLPVEERGLIRVRADLRVGDEHTIFADAWAAGDAAAVPDLTSNGTPRTTVPNAQHAVRQGRRLASNIAAVLRHKEPTLYKHHSLGVVATLGLGRGIFQYRGIVITGVTAWLMHRGYHVLAVPTWERKVRVLAVWVTAVLFDRDIVSLREVQHPREAFVNGGSADTR